MKAYFVNLMWQPGETMGFLASDHVEAIHNHAGRKLIDVAIINTARVEREQLGKYAVKRSQPVTNDTHRLEQMGLEVVGADLLSHQQKVRHDPRAAGEVIVELARRSRREALIRTL